MSQEEFAKTLGFRLSSIIKWEQGQGRPNKSALVLLKLIDKFPETYLKSLEE